MNEKTYKTAKRQISALFFRAFPSRFRPFSRFRPTKTNKNEKFHFRRTKTRKLLLVKKSENESDKFNCEALIWTYLQFFFVFSLRLIAEFESVFRAVTAFSALCPSESSSFQVLQILGRVLHRYVSCLNTYFLKNQALPLSGPNSVTAVKNKCVLAF